MGKALHQMLKVTAAVFALVFSSWGIQAQSSGIYESYLILDLGSGNAFYDLQATTGNPDFTGSLGSFVQCTGTLTLKGAQNKTFKCPTCNITNGTLFYRVYPQGGTPGAFTSLDLPFASDDPGALCGGGQNQTWQTNAATVNLLSGRAAGVYVLEVYTAANYNGCGSGTNFANNGGANYSATFTVTGGATCPVFVTASGGTAFATYTNLKGAFDAVNAGTHTGTIAITIGANTTETATAALNASGSGSANYTSVLVKPGASPVTVSGSIVGAIVRLNGADNVTIDGRISGSGRNLTIQNTNTSTATAAIWLSSNGVGAGAANNTIRNLEIACGATQNTSTSTTFGIIMCGTSISTTSNGDDNDNNTFTENRIIRCRYGITTRGVTTNNNQNITVTNNIVGPDSFGADEIGKVGIFMQADNMSTVSGNTVQFVGGDFANTSAGTDRVGIGIGTDSWSMSPGTLTSANYTVTNNIVHDVIEERTSSAVGITLATTGGGSPTNNIVANNFIYNIKSNGTAGDQTVGLGIAGGHTDRVVFNSIFLSGDVDPNPSASSANNFGSGIRIANTSGTTHANLTLMNNNVSVDLTSSSNSLVRFYAISGPAASYNFGSGGENYNNYYINPSNTQVRTGGIGTTSGVALTTSYTTLANWQTAYTTPQDANSQQVLPPFVSGADLHLVAGSNTTLESGGIAIAGVTTDIDGDTRPNGFAPDIGADEFSGINPNICSGTPTAGTISSSPASICASGSTILTLNGASSGVGISYQWKEAMAPGGPYNNVGTNATTYTTGTINSPRYYVVDVTCATGPNTSTTAEFTLAVNPLPTVMVSPPSGLICNPGGSAVALTASGANTYSWSPATGLDATTGAIVNANPAATTTYTVTGTDANGCQNTATVTVTVGDKPVIQAITATPSTICSGQNSQLNTNAGIFTSTSNGGAVTINSLGNATPYPATINVSGLPTSGVRVKQVLINGLSHTFPSDIDMLLQSPTATNVVLISDQGGSGSISNVNLVLQDGSSAIGTTIVSGTFRPTVDSGSDSYPTPGPGTVTPPSIPTLSSFTGNFNGTWNLFIVDDASGDAGSITSWSIVFEYGAAVTSYSWSPATFLNDATIANPLASNVTATTTYTVTATAASGCFSTANVTVNVNPLPTATVSGGGTVCSTDPLPNVSFALTGTGPWDLTYNDGTNNVPVTGINSTPYVITNAPAGTYTVVSVSDANCSGSGSGSVTVAVTPATTWYQDSDGDSYGNPAVSQSACTQPSGYVANNTDCDDTEAAKFPGNPEICDGLDNNCDGNTDEGLTYVNYYLDGDDDGYGDENATPISACAPPGPIYVTNNNDCNDSDNMINPLATEVCDGIDNDCDGFTDEGVQTTYYLDADADGYYTGSPVMACTSPGAGYVTTVTGGGDCDDSNDDINPGEAEICDGIDNNCNLAADEGLTFVTYYLDNDGDGYGVEPGVSLCANPGPGFVTQGDDCDDSDPNTYAGYTLVTSGSYAPISGTGTLLSLPDDGVSGALPIGFTFEFFEQNYTSFIISSNGFITFESVSSSGCCSGQSIPNPTAPNNLIAAAWDDLYPAGNGSISYFTTGTAPNRILAVNFTNIPLCCGTNPAVTSQILLYEGSNRIEIHTAFANGITPGTMGIENASGTRARAVPGRNRSSWTISNDFVAFVPCGAVVNTYYRDMDGDGFGNPLVTATGLTPPPGYVADNTDCNDNNPLEKPGQVWYKDTDNDGYAQTGAATITQCLRPSGYKAASELTSTTGDCNDNNNAINPAATEVCDGIDNNCNGSTDEGVQTIFYQDFDGDGFGDPAITTLACSAPPNYVANNSDCNDNNALEKPGQVWYKDTDNDGYAQTGAATITQCLRPIGYKAASELTLTTGDCNDNNNAINPAATEVCDGIDNNCNGSTDEGVLTTYYFDFDGDGFGNPSNTTQACSQPVGYVTNNQDCNDNNALEKPGQVWYKDSDNDGYAETGATTITQCLRPGGYKAAVELTSTTGDCNDNNNAINPAATEVCDGIDNNCNGSTDEGVLTTYYFDFDGDGFGNPSNTTQACSQPVGYVTNNQDCNDNNALEKPGQVWYKDSDNDGYAETGATTITQCLRPGGYKAAVELTSTTGDCNDNNNAINPAATEVCDGIDNNCNGSTDEGVLTTYYFDFDGDGFGNPSNTTQACSVPSGYVTNNTDCNDNSALERPGQIWYKDVDNDGYGETGAATITQCLRPVGYKAATEMIATTGDCNDNNFAIKPGVAEICDGIDNNCNGSIDEGVLITYYRDQDGDGFGNPSNTTQACSLPGGYVTNNQDCNDNNALEKPGQVWYKDVDNDGYAETGAATITQCLRPVGYKVAAELISTTGDCNDNNAAIKPGAAEICDGIDNNCNGQIDEPVAISSPWSSANVGSGANGGANQSCSPGNLTTFNVSAQGYSTPTGDMTHTVFQQLCGNASITVRVASVSNDGWAGITMRESLAGGSRMVALKTQLANIGIREARNATNGPKQTQIFPATLLHEWLRITRNGNTFQYFISPDGVNWQLVGTVNIAMGSCLYVGMFAESINVNTTVTASFTNVTVSGGVLPLTGNSDDGPADQFITKQRDFNLYPNPTSGEVNIDLKEYLGNEVRIEVYSLIGQLVYFVEIDEVQTAVTKLDLSVYQNGTYLIRVHTDGQPDTTKWVKLLRP